MDKLIEKISSYKLFNYLFTGIVFAIFSAEFTNHYFISDNVAMGLALYYFIGLLLSRLGSLIIEPLLKKLSFVKFTEYSDFVTASKKDTMLDELSETNNLYRTLSAVFIGIIFLKLYDLLGWYFPCVENYTPIIVLIGLSSMFLSAYRKQTAYITKRIKANL